MIMCRDDEKRLVGLSLGSLNDYVVYSDAANLFPDANLNVARVYMTRTEPARLRWICLCRLRLRSDLNRRWQ